LRRLASAAWRSSVSRATRAASAAAASAGAAGAGAEAEAEAGGGGEDKESAFAADAEDDDDFVPNVGQWFVQLAGRARWMLCARRAAGAGAGAGADAPARDRAAEQEAPSCALQEAAQDRASLELKG